jgi:histidinol-phosphate aminotransferase
VATIDCPQRIENDDFTVDLSSMLHQFSAHPNLQLVFLANPGNPTASLIPLATIRAILNEPSFHGIVVVDEAYIDFSAAAAFATALSLLEEFTNLLVLQTLSKSLGLAGLRVGAAFGHPLIIRELHKVQMPYCVSTPTMALATAALAPALAAPRDTALALLRRLRKALVRDLRDLRIRKALPIGAVLGGNSGNFLLLPILERGLAGCESSLSSCVKDAPSSPPWQRDNGRARSVACRLKREHAIAVRYVGDVPGCNGCLRVTVGREWENRAFCRALEMVLAQQ